MFSFESQLDNILAIDFTRPCCDEFFLRPILITACRLDISLIVYQFLSLHFSFQNFLYDYNRSLLIKL